MTTSRRGRCTYSSARRVGLHVRFTDAEFHAEEMQAQRDRALKWAKAWKEAAHRQRDELRCWQGEAVASVYWESVAHERAIEIVTCTTPIDKAVARGGRVVLASEWDALPFQRRSRL